MEEDMIFADQEVLQCPICHGPLTAPVFQCQIGHTIACSICFPKLELKNECPFCCTPVEKLLESAKLDHQKGSCFFSDCKAVVSPGELRKHISDQHHKKYVEFVLNESFQVTLNPNERTLILHDARNHIRIFLIKTVNRHPPRIAILRFGSQGETFGYDVEASVLIPPRWKEVIGEEIQGFEREFLEIAAAERPGDERVRNLLALLEPCWFPLKGELVHDVLIKQKQG